MDLNKFLLPLLNDLYIHTRSPETQKMLETHILRPLILRVLDILYPYLLGIVIIMGVMCMCTIVILGILMTGVRGGIQAIH